MTVVLCVFPVFLFRWCTQIWRWQLPWVQQQRLDKYEWWFCRLWHNYHGCIVAECGMLWLYMVMLVAKHAYWPWHTVVVDSDTMLLRTMTWCGCDVAISDTLRLCSYTYVPWCNAVVLLQTMTQYGSVVANYDTVWLCGYRPWHSVVMLMQIMTHCSCLVTDHDMLR